MKHFLFSSLFCGFVFFTNCSDDNSSLVDSQKDTDGDGVTDDLDTCADTPIGEMVDLNGCIKYVLPLNIGIETLDDILILGNSITYSSENPSLEQMFEKCQMENCIPPTKITST